MTLIHVPRPPKSAKDPSRPVSALLKTQIQHLYEAELKLPIGQQTNIYTNAIKTEGEAARYIQAVTEAIHDAHAEAAARRARPVRARKKTIELAAVAEMRPARRRVSKKNSKKRGRKK
jgi:hypothetical protein